jgi:hypothetical protein
MDLTHQHSHQNSDRDAASSANKKSQRRLPGENIPVTAAAIANR